MLEPSYTVTATATVAVTATITVTLRLLNGYITVTLLLLTVYRVAARPRRPTYCTLEDGRAVAVTVALTVYCCCCCYRYGYFTGTLPLLCRYGYPCCRQIKSRYGYSLRLLLPLRFLYRCFTATLPYRSLPLPKPCCGQIKKAYCPPEVVEANPILDYCKHILFAWSGEVKCTAENVEQEE